MESEEFEINGDVCQKCGNCCKNYRWYTKDKDLATRLSWLDGSIVSVNKVGDNAWMISINISCSKLYKKDGRWMCIQYKGFRPKMCKDYPLEFLSSDKTVLKYEKKKCKELKRLDKIKNE